MPVGIGAHQLGCDLGAIDRRRQSSKSMIHRRDIEASEVKQLQNAVIRQQPFKIGRTFLTLLDLHHMRVPIAKGQLHQTQPIPMRVQAHGLAINGNRRAKGQIVRQVVLVQMVGQLRLLLRYGLDARAGATLQASIASNADGRLTPAPNPGTLPGMKAPDVSITAREIAHHIRAMSGNGRQLIAIAGPPAAGKSTVAEAVVAELGDAAALVPMDGFHYSNAILEARGLRPRKGAPETFDLAGFKALLARLKSEDKVAVPTFDRSLDASIGSSRPVEAHHQTLIVEGNYLLLDEPGWRDLAEIWDFSVFLDVPTETLKTRLIQRWLDHGFDPAGAEEKALSNDIPNALRVVEMVLAADLTISS